VGGTAVGAVVAAAPQAVSSIIDTTKNETYKDNFFIAVAPL